MMINGCEHVLKRAEHTARLFVSETVIYLADDRRGRCFITIHRPSFNQFVISHGVECIAIGHDTETSDESIVCWNGCLTRSLSDVPNFDLNSMRVKQATVRCMGKSVTSPSQEPERSNES